MIPKEWLPVQPLAAYEDPYEFMRAYEGWLATKVPENKSS
jgi:hypothetical protein